MNLPRLPKPHKSLRQLLVVLLFGMVLSSLALFTLPTQAQEPGLVTCGLQNVGTEAESAFCTICDLIVLVQNIMNKAMYVFAAPIAAFMLGYGGFLMVWAGVKGGDTGMYGKGKTVMTNSIIGIVIIFSSWLLIDTLMKGLGAYQYAVSANFGPWNKIECSAPPISLPKHMGCNGDKCEMIAGSGSATCSGNENCGANAKHLGCADQKCAYVSGSGTNDCAEGDDPVCKKRNTHKICASVGQCIEVDGPGPNICNTNPDCKAGGTTGSGIDIIDNVGLANELRAAGIGLSNSASCSGASARTNFDELQNGQPLTVCHSGCSTDGIACQQKGNTVLPQMLIDLKNLKQGQNLNFQINSLMTGDHGPNSDHYQGKGVDLKPLLGTTYQQLYDAINQEKNLRGNIRLVQCENESGKVDCTKGSPNHIHISYKYKL